MQAIILAAGKGVRMKPLTDKTPKPMLKINGRPILEYTFSALPEEVDEVLLVVNYLKEQIIDYFGKKWQNKKIKYLEGTLKGTASELFHYQEQLKDDKFLVLYADDLYLKSDLEKLLNHQLALLAYEMAGIKRLGILEVDENNILKDIKENPQAMNNNGDKTKFLVNTGAYLLDKRIFNYPMKLVTKEEYGLPQTLITVSREYGIYVEKAKWWLPIGQPEDLKRAEQEIKSNLGINNY